MIATILTFSLTGSLLLNIVLTILTRLLWISPSFGIAGQAAGWVKVWLTFGPRIWTYIDMDHLGDINDILTTPTQAGADRWNELARELLRKVRCDDMFLIYGGDEFGFASRTDSQDARRQRADGRAFGERLQALMRTLDYTEAERARLQARLGTPYVTCTIASAYSPGWRQHRHAIRAAGARVAQAKPKDRKGQRGEILEAIV